MNQYYYKAYERELTVQQKKQIEPYISEYSDAWVNSAFFYSRKGQIHFNMLIPS